MFVLSAMFGTLVSTAHAASLDQWGQNGPGVAQMWQTIRNTLYTQQDPVTALSGAVTNFIFPLVGAGALIMVLYAGLRMITGEGKDESWTKAKEIILYALLGVVLAVLASVIIGYFATVFFPVLFT